MTTRAAIAAMLLAIACSRAPAAREYQVIGQVVRVDRDTRQVTLQHQDIVGFMPGMTMPFKVRDEALMDATTPGDLVTATLVVEEVEAYLSAIVRTGHAPIAPSTPVPSLTDADLLKPGDTVPDTPLVDQDGTPSPLSSLRGHRVALTFVYTRCPLPEFCPLMDRHFASVQKAVAATPSLADVQLVTVTFDPDFDTPAVLAGHAKAVGADPKRWRFVTGGADDVAALAKRFGVIAERQDADPATVVHNLRTAVIGPDGRLATITSGNDWTAADLIADLTATPAPTH